MDIVLPVLQPCMHGADSTSHIQYNLLSIIDNLYLCMSNKLKMLKHEQRLTELHPEGWEYMVHLASLPPFCIAHCSFVCKHIHTEYYLYGCAGQQHTLCECCPHICHAAPSSYKRTRQGVCHGFQHMEDGAGACDPGHACLHAHACLGAVHAGCTHCKGHHWGGCEGGKHSGMCNVVGLTC